MLFPLPLSSERLQCHQLWVGGNGIVALAGFYCALAVLLATCATASAIGGEKKDDRTRMKRETNEGVAAGLTIARPPTDDTNLVHGASSRAGRRAGGDGDGHVEPGAGLDAAGRLHLGLDAAALGRLLRQVRVAQGGR